MSYLNKEHEAAYKIWDEDYRYHESIDESNARGIALRAIERVHGESYEPDDHHINSFMRYLLEHPRDITMNVIHDVLHLWAKEYGGSPLTQEELKDLLISIVSKEKPVPVDEAKIIPLYTAIKQANPEIMLMTG